MPFVSVSDPRYSDVVLQEDENLYSRARATATITTATGTYKQGTVLFRTKSIDPTVAWDVVDAVGDISIANEYAILIGDNFKPTEAITLTNAVARDVLTIKRFARLKESVLKDIYITGYSMSATDFNKLKHVLSLQGILVEDSLTAIA